VTPLAANPYRELVRSSLPRARALIDRTASSSTYGASNRNYWYYRTLTDFPGGSWQQLMLGFAVLSTIPDEPSINLEEMHRLARATLAGWLKAQHRDGSVDEWYLNERSYCATAFGMAGATQTVLLLGEDLPAEERQRAVAALGRAGAWLRARWHKTVMNQNLAAALGLWCLARITGDRAWERASDEKYAALAKEQSPEGWFPEYGGMDLGYSTLALDLLAGADRWGARAAFPMAEQLCTFLLNTRGADGGFPGRIGSRGTSHTFAFGAEYFSDRLSTAAALASGFRAAYATGGLTGPAHVDDRYFAYFYFPQFAQAYAFGGLGGTHPETASAASQESVVNLSGAGLQVVRKGDATLHVSRHVGGALALSRPGLPVAYHLGYEITARDGRRYSSAGWQDDALPPDPEVSQASFRRVSEGLPLVRFMVPFVLFVRLLALPWLAEWFSSFLKRRMIRPPQQLDVTLTRRVSRRRSDITVVDELVTSGRINVRAIRSTMDIAMYSPSARFDCARPLFDDGEDRSWTETLNKTGRLRIGWTISFASEEERGHAS
jgi:hypothetical protein